MTNIKNTIGWADFSWNPFTGCKKGCSYCYAASLHNKRHKAYLEGKLQNHKQYAKPFNEIQFFPERLSEPSKLKTPSKIFVGNMGEIFDLEPEQIIQIIKICEENPQHNFMFLTQRPNLYRDYATFHVKKRFPENCMLGYTITIFNEKKLADFIDSAVDNRLFLSIEPIKGIFPKSSIYQWLDLIIIGAMTGKNPVIPKKEWFSEIQHPNIFYKKNLFKYFPELKENKK
jgi:protein gp37